MIKNFVFDTNVLLHDPQALQNFGDNNVIIPIYVIEEVDQFKREMTERGRNAREVSRLLDRYRQQGNLGEGVALENGGMIRVEFAIDDIPRGFVSKEKPDNLILSVALRTQREEPGTPCILLTKDVNLRVRANAMGLKSENYEERNVDFSDMYSGSSEFDVPNGLLTRLHADGRIELDLDDHPGFRNDNEELERLYVNEYVLLKNNAGKQTAFARVIETHDDGQVGILRPLGSQQDAVWGIKPRNKEQLYALDALLDDSIDLVTLVGMAGTGKTLLGIAAGLRKVTEEQKQHKLLVARPVIPMGRDIGFLPGTMEEKLTPWMRPIFDNVEYLMGLSRADKRAGRGADELIDMGIIEIEALTYIRGRSLPHQYMIVDEAQNLTPHEAKTILTRVGEGTKIILTGDPYQIDNPYVDMQSNGLTYVAERFKGQERAATVTLRKGERSPLAELAANLL